MENFEPKVGQIAHFRPWRIKKVEIKNNDKYPIEITFEGIDRSLSYQSNGNYYSDDEENSLDIIALEDYHKPKTHIEQITAYRCPVCKTLHESLVEAEECCHIIVETEQ